MQDPKPMRPTPTKPVHGTGPTLILILISILLPLMKPSTKLTPATPGRHLHTFFTPLKTLLRTTIPLHSCQTLQKQTLTLTLNLKMKLPCLSPPLPAFNPCLPNATVVDPSHTFSRNLFLPSEHAAPNNPPMAPLPALLPQPPGPSRRLFCFPSTSDSPSK